MKKTFFEVSQTSQESTCASLFFNKTAGMRLAILFKKRLQHRFFPINFEKFLREPIL